MLSGHSLGGYLAVHYAIKYPGMLSKLCLLSGVGIPIKPDDYNQKKTHSLYEKTKASLWQKNYSPMSLMRAAGKYGTNKFLNGYVNEHVLIAFEEEKELFKELMH